MREPTTNKNITFHPDSTTTDPVAMREALRSGPYTLLPYKLDKAVEHCVPPEPIIEFQTQAELDACLAYWQECLFLSSWIIKAELCDVHELSNNQACGECESTPTASTAMIRVLRKEQYPADALEKYCAEQTLVHELLHCKYITIEDSDKSIESCFYDNAQHSLLEQMAKSLIMAKYNLPFSWFKNF